MRPPPGPGKQGKNSSLPEILGEEMEKLVELAELMLLSQGIEINSVRAENHRRD